MVGGSFTDYNGTGRGRLIRLNADGSLDTAFTDAASRTGTTANFNGTVSSIALQSNGKVLVGGNFTNYAGTNGRSRLIRLNADGTLDTDFCVNASDGAKFSNTILSIAVQSDGKVLVGGNFTYTQNNISTQYLVRFS